MKERRNNKQKKKTLKIIKQSKEIFKPLSLKILRNKYLMAKTGHYIKSINMVKEPIRNFRHKTYNHWGKKTLNGQITQYY